jgi:exodeoxyribonuclease-3
MRLMTWNINSVRLRIDSLLRVIDAEKPDIFCLQETKTRDEFFPLEPLIEKGFKHHHYTGIKSYNGVAIFSKFPLSNKQIHQRCGKEDARHISAVVNDKFELHNIYIPAGGNEPDPVINEKFQHKLDFVDELSTWFEKTRNAKDKMIAVGDFNIAPLEHDVWNHKQMLKVVSHTPIEIEKFAQFYDSMQWADAIRHFVPDDQKLYSWWSYRAADWITADKGRRLDHIWVTQNLKPALHKHSVFRDARGWVQPSDHVPVILELKKGL